MKKVPIILASLLVSLTTTADKAFGNYTWPMTQTYETNPLFVGFPSQLYNSDGVGHFYSADPSAHVWTIDGKQVLYVYASHDQEPASGCGRMDKYHVFSTTDMKSWTDNGEILNASQVDWSTPKNAPDAFMWAPDCAYKNGIYYFYFPHPSDCRTDSGQWNKTWKVGIATSTSPAGGFKVQGYIHNLGDAKAMIDPCVFVDDDGSAYFYYGGGGRCVAAKLKDNMMEIEDSVQRMDGLKDFHEAAWVFKRNGIYYLTYSDNHATNVGGNNLCYATSASPLGPWNYQGIYMLPNGFDTAHGSVVEYKGKWYQFYHTGNYSTKGNLRSVCFDELTFDDEGHINIVHTWGRPKGDIMPEVSITNPLRIEAEDYNDGGSHHAYFKRPTTMAFELGNPHTGLMETKSEGDVTYLKSMAAAEWVRYSLNAQEDGRFTITLRMRQTSDTRPKIRLGLDGNWTRSTETEVNTGANTWGDVEFKNLELSSGDHFIEIRITKGSVDIDAIDIAKSVQNVPGTVEAEDYDDGGYLFQNTKKAGNTYRRDQGVAIGTRGCLYIGDTSSGDWFNYTFVGEPGIYTVSSYVANPRGGKFYIDFDGGEQKLEEMEAKTSGWQDFQSYSQEGVELSAGQHVVTFHVVSPLNFDRLSFVKTGELMTGIAGVKVGDMEPDGAYYNLQGMRVEKPYNNIYIKNGRKVIVR